MWSAFFVYFLGMMVGTLRHDGKTLFIIVGLVGFTAAVGLILFLLFRIRCPNCRGNVGYAFAWPPTWDLSVHRAIKYCPYCGIDIDKQIKT